MSKLNIKSLPCNAPEATHCISGSFDNGECTSHGIQGYYTREKVGLALSEMFEVDPAAKLRVEPYNVDLVEAPLCSTDVEWIVNDLGEIGVKIGYQQFFLYKGESFMYSSKEEDGPSTYRLIGKRELGEVLSLDSTFDKDGFLDRGTFYPLDFKTAKQQIAWYSSEERY